MLRRSRALALGARAAALAALGRPAEAQQVAEEVIDEFAEDPIQGPKRINVVAGGRFTRAVMLLVQQEVGAAQAALADLIVDYRDDEAPSVRLLMAKARLQQARALQRLDDVDTAAGIRLALIDEYGGCEDRQFREVAVTAGLHHGSASINAGRPSDAVTVAERLQGLMTARPLPDNPTLELSVLLMLARAQRRSSDPDAAASTLRAVLGRDDLLAVARGHTKRVAALIAAILPDLARAGEHVVALELVDVALRKLRSSTSDPERLTGLWLYRPEYGDDEDSFTRVLVADVIAQKANLLLKRRRRRSALRTLGQLIAYCGDPPAEPMRKSAELARNRIAAITTARADRRRLRVVAFALLAWSLAPAVRAGLRALQRSGASRRL